MALLNLFIANDNNPKLKGAFKVFSHRKLKLFENLEKGEIVNKENQADIYELASIGLARLSIIIQENQPENIVFLTPLRKRMLQVKKIMKNPIKNFFIQC